MKDDGGRGGERILERIEDTFFTLKNPSLVRSTIGTANVLTVLIVE